MSRPLPLRSLAAVAFVSAALTAIPWLAMRHTAEVAWQASDFATAFALLFATGVAIVAARRVVPRGARRAWAMVGIVAAAALVWAELAVGVFR